MAYTNWSISTNIDPSLSAISYAPLGSALPSIGKTMPSAYIDAGLIHDDGITLATNFEEGEVVNAWPATEIGRGKSTKSPEISFGFLGTADMEKLKLAYAASNISGTANAFTITETEANPEDKIIVFNRLLGVDQVTGNRKRQRDIIVHGVFAGREDQEFDGESADSISVTYRAQRTETGVYTIRQTWIDVVGGSAGD